MIAKFVIQSSEGYLLPTSLLMQLELMISISMTLAMTPANSILCE